MEDYKEYSIYTLYRIHCMERSKRKDIELHLETRTEKEKKEFKDLQNETLLSYLKRHIYSEGQEVVKLSEERLNKAKKLMQYDFILFKKYINEIIIANIENEVNVRSILLNEGNKQNSKFNELKSKFDFITDQKEKDIKAALENTDKYKNISFIKSVIDNRKNQYRDEKKFYENCFAQIICCIQYIKDLQLKSYPEIFKEISYGDHKNINVDPETKISKESKPNEHTSKETLTQKELALYYVYLHDSKCEPYFRDHPNGTVKALQEVAKKHNVSYKNFQLQYNKVVNPNTRICNKNIKNIRNVIMHLRDKPNALKLAQDELKKAELM